MSDQRMIDELWNAIYTLAVELSELRGDGRIIQVHTAEYKRLMAEWRAGGGVDTEPWTDDDQPDIDEVQGWTKVTTRRLANCGGCGRNMTMGAFEQHRCPGRRRR